MDNNEVSQTDSKINFISRYCRDRIVLDIGVVQHRAEMYASSSWLHRAICRISRECVGIDIDEEGVRLLTEKGYNVKLADAQDFDLGRNFDVIVAGDIIEHLDNFSGFLNSISKHMGDDSKLLLTTPNVFWWRWAVNVLFKGSATPHEQHTCWFCPDTLRQLLERHGFQIVSLEYSSVYRFETIWQFLNKAITTILPAPARIRHNTMLVVAIPI